MISNRVLAMSASISAGLTADDILALPMQNTPLAILSRTVLGPMLNSDKLSDILASDENLDEAIVNVSSLNRFENSDDVAQASHTVALETQLQFIASKLVKHLQFARGAVVKRVNTVYDKVSSLVEAAKPMPYSIIPMYLDKYFKNTSLMDMVNNYKGAQVASDLPTASAFKDLSESQLIDVMKTGLSSLDNLTLDLLANKPTGYMTALYNSYFRGQRGDDVIVTYVKRNNINVPMVTFPVDFLQVDRYILLLMLVNGLSRAYPSDLFPTTNKIGNIQVAILAGLHKALCSAIYETKSQWDVALRVEKVVSYGGFKGTSSCYVPVVNAIALYVIGPMYDKFISLGGEADVVIGAAIYNKANNSHISDIKGLLANAAILKRRYMLETERLELDHINKTLGLVKGSLYNSLLDEVYNTTEEELAVLNTTKDDLILLVDKYVKELSDGDYTDSLYKTIRRLICDIFYPHTSALRLLETMSQYMDDNPEGDVKVAAYHAQIELLLDFWLSQVDFNKVTSKTAIESIG